MTTKVTITHDGHNSGMDVMVRTVNPTTGVVSTERVLGKTEVFEGYIHSGSKFEIIEVPKL